MNETRYKVLVSAYACEPNSGSEPGVGWNCVNQIARFHETWVVTRANNRAAIEQVLAKTPMPNVHWIYVDLPRWARFWKRGQRGVRLYYYLWQIAAYLAARRIHRRVNFDLVHHVTFVNFWLPSFLSLLPVPFVWGPVGGGESAPKFFYNTFSWQGRFYEYSRDLVRYLAQFDPFVRLTAQRSKIALATTEQTAERMKKLGAGAIQILPEAALPPSELKRLNSLTFHRNGIFRIVSIGRLLHWKGFHLGLSAFAKFHQRFPASEYWVFGNGPEEENLKQASEKLGVADRVKFFGKVEREQVIKLLSDCDVLVHPSLHDSGGWVCLEAMAAGRPVICLDWGGPSVQVEKDTGIKIPVKTQKQIIDDLSAAMLALAEKPALRSSMSQKGRQRIREAFCWNVRGNHFNELYQKALSSI